MALGWAIRKMGLTWSRVIRNCDSSLWGPCEESVGDIQTHAGQRLGRDAVCGCHAPAALLACPGWRQSPIGQLWDVCPVRGRTCRKGLMLNVTRPGVGVVQGAERE